MKLEVKNYSLKYTLYPSFTLTMFKFEDGKYVKICGYCKGLTLRQINNIVEVESCEDFEYVMDITGLWYEPERYVSDVSRDYRDFIDILIEKVSCIRISVSRQDYKIILISTFLSRNTDYYTNVIRWIHKLCELTDNLQYLDRDIVLKIGTSYQIVQLSEVFQELLDIDIEDNFWNIRRRLLKIKYVGPKVADAFLIFTKCTTEIAPTDIHYSRFIKKFKLFKNIEITYPSKNYCIKYTCDTCPRSSRCVTGLTYKYFGRLSSWIQTVSYVIDREFCTKSRCGECMLGDVCRTTR